MLCISSIYSIVAPVAVLGIHPSDSDKPLFLGLNYTLFQYITLGFLGLQYFWFFVVFAVNRLAEPVFPCRARDSTGCIRNLFHFIMAWPTMIGYCIVELFAFLEVTVRGKAVCSHSASKKDALVQKVTSISSVDRG
ncbi:unnamed protein product [Gongylonema pulchrum]|uniref:G_PROTEIN_RECEP_F2_4 domain-containing protein n=1 Tax=Gongylonema pulchrum TaxID=637853 RepID=A0A183F0W0_9BILA|nr:unnamed protein product [Gongylonema pulchrum]VDN49608.1 unnamed protein product [Gongylonema pulchrum]